MRSVFIAVCGRTEVVIGNESLKQNNLSSKVKTLAGNSDISLPLAGQGGQIIRCLFLYVCFIGVAMQSFDSVSIDSELDSVCTEHIRQHLNRQAGERVKKMCWYKNKLSLQMTGVSIKNGRGNKWIVLIMCDSLRVAFFPSVWSGQEWLHQPERLWYTQTGWKWSSVYVR